MRREGIAFDVGVAVMFGFGETGFNPHRFVMNEILIENAEPYGVRLADGTEILADRVVADATTWNLCRARARTRARPRGSALGLMDRG